MQYLFEIIGVSPVLAFFNHQQSLQQRLHDGAAYISTYHCTLDALLSSVEEVPHQRGWQLDRVVESVIYFWSHNAESIKHWQKRLEDAGRENLLVARIADVESLRLEFESILHRPDGS